MWLRIDHTSSYSYDEPIAEAYTELRLRPLVDGGQHRASFRLETTPPGVRIREYRDQLGNDVLHFDVLERHDYLEVRAMSEVMTPDAFTDSRRALTQLERHDFLLPTAYAPFSDEIRAFAATHVGGAEDGVAGRAREIARAIWTELVYDPRATDVRTRADEALELGRGVCQDFAHILLASCRSEGIPARYVSGYLYDPAIEGGNAASHAWVDIWEDERGWVSLDPTHDREQNDHYVRVAIGRDYADVPPTRGVWRGNAIEQLDVSVTLSKF
jgi:transglutaminase-like putative cysteine protease